MVSSGYFLQVPGQSVKGSCLDGSYIGLHMESSTSQSIGLTKRTAVAGGGDLSHMNVVVSAHKQGLQACQK